MKIIFEKIQSCIFELILEKWDEIYLYASVIQDKNNKQTGEMFLYYIPKGALFRKKPVNVYEVPRKFNINEGEYLKIVDALYENIKELQQEFKNTNQDVWTNLSISIAHTRFKVEFFYDEVLNDKNSSYIRHVIWRYKYLHVGGEIKEEKDILENYFKEVSMSNAKSEVYQTGLYVKSSNNLVGFDKEIEEEKNRQNELEKKEIENEKKKKKKRRKNGNQILNY